MKLSNFQLPYDVKYAHNIFSSISKDNCPVTLDVGCGYGEKTLLFKALSCDIVGLDVSIEKAKKAKEKGIEVLVGDAEHLPFKNEIFGAVTVFHVIEHINDAAKMLNETYRVLQEGGFSIFVTPNKRRLTFIISLFIRILKPKMKYPLNPDHVFEYSKKDLWVLLLRSKFRSYYLSPLVFGVISSRHTFGLKRPPKILSNFCSQWFVYAKK